MRGPDATSRIAQKFRAYRGYILDDVMNNVTLASAHQRRFEGKPLAGLTMSLLNRTLARSSLFRNASRAIERKVNRSEEVHDFLRTLRPDLLVIPNPFGTIETIYLLHARELGIRTVCQMLSWDNITSKGTPLLMPDYFISWGPVMTDEMTNLYKFPRDRIYECGVPHFDVYNHTASLTPREALLRELDLPVELPYIFYGTVTWWYCPNEIEILAWLADRVSKDAFARSCSLVIRPHPQTISGVHSNQEHLRRLKSLIGPRVALDLPPVLSEQLAWDLPKTDMYRLASLLAGSSMCLNASSTLCLDAAMADRPVVDIAFDGHKELPYEKSARRVTQYIHMAKLLAFGGIRIAGSFEGLRHHINDYLENPCQDYDARLLAAAQECGPRDGRAAERVSRVLLKLASRDSSLSAACAS